MEKSPLPECLTTTKYTIQNPPTKSRQLNTWLATLSGSDLIEAMDSNSFSEQCHPFVAATNRLAPLIKWSRSGSSTHPPTMSSSAARIDPQGSTPGTLAAASSKTISPRSSRVAPVTPEVYPFEKSSGQFSEKSSGLPLDKSSGLPLEKSYGLLSEKCSEAYFTEFGNNTLCSPPAVVGSACNFVGPSNRGAVSGLGATVHNVNMLEIGTKGPAKDENTH